jgi:hypothetical protein
MKLTHFICFFGLMYLTGVGCQRHHPAQTAAATHLISVSQPGSMLYLDRLDNHVILSHEDTMGTTTFCSFLVGLRDSSPVSDAKRLIERERYIQYGMQQNWTALVNGDSIRPVFFQEKPHLDQQLREGAMVFEVPRGRRPDTLIYRDTFGTWGTQVFVLNGKSL